MHKEWNPEYLIYCRSKGHTDPEDQLAFDKAAYVGVTMTGFARWTNEHLERFSKIIKVARFAMSNEDRENYQQWLGRLYPEKKRA